jgi:prevent-host-death family protein
MGTVGVKELKNRLTEYLRRTKNGEEIVVTERGHPIAILRSIHSTVDAQSLEAKLAKLAAQGRLALPSKKPQKKIRAVKITGTPLSKTIVESRR